MVLRHPFVGAYRVGGRPRLPPAAPVVVALELAAAGVETGGAAHNRRFLAGALEIGPGVDPARVTLAFDPQTSGGLLGAVPADRLPELEGALREAGQPWWRTGRMEPGAGIALAA